MGPGDAGGAAAFIAGRDVGADELIHDIKIWRSHTTYLGNFLKKNNYADEAQRLEPISQIGARPTPIYEMGSKHPGQIGIRLASLPQIQNRRIPGQFARDNRLTAVGHLSGNNIDGVGSAGVHARSLRRPAKGIRAFPILTES